MAQVKAIACELPARRALPWSRLSAADVWRVAQSEARVNRISLSTVRRWLAADALRPWRYRLWIFPRGPDFEPKARAVLDLYQGIWQGERLGSDCYVISADEKTSIQARRRCHAPEVCQPGRPMRVEHEYERGGALAYLAALDVRRGKVIGYLSEHTGVDPFHELVRRVMEQEPYARARRVFWIVDNGPSHRPTTCPQRLARMYPNAVAVHLPIHASWLNQIELYFSILQRKVLTPNDFPDVQALEERILRFQEYHNRQAGPFRWTFTREKLESWYCRLKQAA